jgi:hypothetical protein
VTRPVIVKVSYTTSSNRESAIWLYKIIEKIILNQIQTDSAFMKGVLISDALSQFRETEKREETN